jgi:O-succinylbenzoic acid--CoA ligase
VAILAPDARWTFGEWHWRASAVAARLENAGVRAGDRVALLGWNSAAYAAAVFGVSRAGGIVAPLNARLSPAELAWQLDDLGAVALVHDAACAGVAREIAAVRSRPALLPLEDAVAAPAVAEPPRPVDLAAVQTIVYTSGTTGWPRGAMLTWGNHVWSALASALNLGLRDDDRWLACLPMFHVGGLSLLFKSALYGMPLVVHESFDPKQANRAIDDDGVTMVSVVATMLQRMLDARGQRSFPPSLRCVLLGGGPAPSPLLEACAGRGVPVVQTYGLTEAASQVATMPPAAAPARPGSAGRPLPGIELRVVREDGSDAAPGEAGSILVRGPVVMTGYWNRPDATARALEGGWLRTGDIGALDDEGYLYVLDRRDDLIISGGENVYPAEVEAALLAHPAVAEAGVVGMPDERWGQSVVAAVVLAPGARVSEDELRAFCHERLARYKTPARIRFVEALPRTVAGKLQRRALREKWLAGEL